MGQSGVRSEILGTVRLRVGETTVAATRPTVRNVLGALLMHPGQTLSVARLTELAWGPEGCSSGTLHTTVSRLREFLAKHCGPTATVTWEGNGYRLRLPHSESDFADYQRLVRAPRPTDPHERARVLHHALGLWRGPLFAD